MRKIIVFMLLIFSSFVKAQSYEYKFKLNNSITEEVKYIQDKMYQIFDVMPLFSDSTNTFYVKTNVNISQADFSSKILEFGYSVLSFTKLPYDIEKKEDEKVD